MFTWLLFNTLCALPLAFVALLARRSTRVPPAVEHSLWFLVLARLVLPPLALGGEAGESAAKAAVVASGPPSLGDELVAATTRLFGPDWSTAAARGLLVFFLALLAFVVVREIRRGRAVEACVRRAADADLELTRHVRAVAARLGLRAPAVRVSSEVAGPFLWSPRRPVLVLPAAGGRPEATVLAHELAHLARRDHWTAWFELLVQGFHFWNPLFWLARRNLHRAAELACDRWVIERFPDERRAFASALVATAERAAGRFVPRAVQAIGSDARDFEERLVCILHGQAARAWRLLTALGLALTSLSLPGLAAPTLAEFRRALPELPAGTDREHWQRSLAAAEERLRGSPDDGAAVLQRGVALLALGRAEESLRAFRRQEELGLQPAKALYNQACALVRLEEFDSAMAALDRAALLGMDVAEYLAIDPDLAPLRNR